MHIEWTDQLSDYLDHELPAGARTALEAHLEGCADCRGVLRDLELLVQAAPAYAGTEPAPEVWGRVVSGIDATRTVAFPVRPERRFSIGQMIAAAAVVAILAAGGMWSVMRPGTSGTDLASEAPDGVPTLVPVASLLDDPEYDAAVRELEASLEAGREVLDSATVRIIDDNLKVIDAAIAEARAAIAADPSNAYLGSRVKLHMQRKMVLLRQAVRAAGAAT